MLLIPRQEGVETRPIKTSYSSSAGTAYITFDNVLVPVENLIGEMDKGFPIILSKFVVFLPPSSLHSLTDSHSVTYSASIMND